MPRVFHAVLLTLILPASVTGAGTFMESMTGQTIQSGSTVRFQQTADTFVRDLTWTREGTSLTVRNQMVGSAAFTNTLTRQLPIPTFGISRDKLAIRSRSGLS